VTFSCPIINSLYSVNNNSSGTVALINNNIQLNSLLVKHDLYLPAVHSPNIRTSLWLSKLLCCSDPFTVLLYCVVFLLMLSQHSLVCPSLLGLGQFNLAEYPVCVPPRLAFTYIGGIPSLRASKATSPGISPP